MTLWPWCFHPLLDLRFMSDSGNQDQDRHPREYTRQRASWSTVLWGWSCENHMPSHKTAFLNSLAPCPEWNHINRVLKLEQNTVTSKHPFSLQEQFLPPGATCPGGLSYNIILVINAQLEILTLENTGRSVVLLDRKKPIGSARHVNTFGWSVSWRLVRGPLFRLLHVTLYEYHSYANHPKHITQSIVKIVFWLKS